MNTLTFWEATTGAAAIGFSVGWLCGMFLGLWCSVSLWGV